MSLEQELITKIRTSIEILESNVGYEDKHIESGNVLNYLSDEIPQQSDIKTLHNANSSLLSLRSGERQFNINTKKISMSLKNSIGFIEEKPFIERQEKILKPLIIKEKITLKWIMENLSLKWACIFIASYITVFLLGLGVITIQDIINRISI
ncbi:hypothetical protein [Reinekea thalattae]|uniref:Uncharacterized protein n=1 Tax=Reinekea thalattae TaxID=2593301 RepID=A0A5C8Z4G6_9GAMM|nr:hypothetical protein [Reinekea thalattae]TXR52088.1 hypothetical protein FME95_11780 [Reinekea thalattae]